MIFLRVNKKCFNAFTGIAVGICNGFFGSGGGMIAVPMLEKGGSEAKKAHATSIAITLPLSIISGLVYFKGGSLDFSQAVTTWDSWCGSGCNAHEKAFKQSAETYFRTAYDNSRRADIYEIG